MAPLARTLLGLAIFVPATISARPPQEAAAGVVYEGAHGKADAPLPGNGKNVVLLAGDEEYRSEEALPMLAKILAVHHGFHCTVLFATDPKSGAIDPDQQTHIPGLAALDHADLVVVFWRFRELPDADMKHFVDYVESGRPLIGIRTATHAFQYQRNKQSPYAKWSFDSSEWPGGFGQQVLGDTWVAHHGSHGSQSTRGVVEPANKEHPILRGVKDVWGPTDVYAITHLLPSDVILLRGSVLQGMKPTDPPVAGAQNSPMMPLLWCRERTTAHGAHGPQRIVASTIGAAVDLECADLRRAYVNACYWAMHLEDKIDPASDVSIVGDYQPTFFGFGKAKKGVMPGELALPAAK